MLTSKILMSKLHIGILREGKIPIDKRVPFTPQQASDLTSKNSVVVTTQKSDIRCYTDSEYEANGVAVHEDLSKADFLFGVKEVPINDLIPDKTYFFFSHTIKKQPYNRDLLQEVLKKNIRLVDYECLVDESDRRVVAFGRYAGLVGTYNAIYTFGKRYNLFHLRRAHECFDLDDLLGELSLAKLPPVKIALTGGGRVAKGAMEILHSLGVNKVSPHNFTREIYNQPVFTQLNARDYNKRIDGGDFSRSEFYSSPEEYESNFLQFASVADILVGAAFWDPRAPALFTTSDALSSNFSIKVIADITCDIEGSIPSTKKASTIDDPVYDYNPSDDKLEPPFSDEGNISVMAVDNLPCELPRNASEDFGKDLIAHVIPAMLKPEAGDIIDRATIARDGKLTEKFSYLQDYVDGK